MRKIDTAPILQVGERQPPARRRSDAVDIGGVDLMAEPREQAIGRIGVRDAAPPVGQDFVIGPQEAHVRFKVGIVDDPLVRARAVPTAASSAAPAAD